ncbi:cleavage and polyadenylation specificity factor subunit 7-like isoform X2 [Sphaeramia orbicularis]|uniref:cleavage and polyadenylation specificity factor subunit 7-like isoform X2 n=1 Tax=Sphaeramia orbicularis TaxID=375764 RepID=UPI00117C2D67|nr:cleavage and polyadenylation specificity factor subunit 7-like isoform X2 [Sphaeramia orbicularis]
MAAAQPAADHSTSKEEFIDLYSDLAEDDEWTTDKDIMTMAHTLSVKDVTDIKFAENKVNGQSRGYAEVVVISEESMKVLLEKVPQCKLHGESLDCRFATHQNLSLFEDIANKRIPMRAPSKESDSTENIPSLLSQETKPHTVSPPFSSHPFTNSFPPIPSPFLSQPPPLFPPLPPPQFLPTCPPYVPGHPSSTLHINPAFVNPMQDGNSSKAYSHQKPTSQRTDADFEELMNRNQAIASGAITKAMSGATTGDLRVAMETLLTAIAIIKQSRVYRDDRCQALVTSLKDCLVSIQGKYGYRSGRSSGDRDRDRGRDRVRDRDRDRGWDREDSSGWEGPRTSRRHRDRSWSGERDKERSRERDRHRDQRDRYR